MKSLYLFTVTLVTFISCNSNQFETLNENSDVHKVFNSDEIFSLNIIVMFFDSTIIKNTKEEDISQAYYEYFKNINTSESLEGLRNCVGVANSSSVQALIEKLKNRCDFNEIWKYSFDHEYKSNDTLSLRLSLNLQGKYFQLLELLEKNNDFMKQYCSSVQGSGYINPSLVASVMKHYKDVNFQESVNRLIWAVHYITILSNEPYIKNM
jgi:hypothetical protein